MDFHEPAKRHRQFRREIERIEPVRPEACRLDEALRIGGTQNVADQIDGLRRGFGAEQRGDAVLVGGHARGGAREEQRRAQRGGHRTEHEGERRHDVFVGDRENQEEPATHLEDRRDRREVASAGQAADQMMHDHDRDGREAGIDQRELLPRLAGEDAQPVEQLTEQAQSNIKKLLEHLNYVGVLTLELFVTSEGGAEKLLANEIAPRVHNSGHATIDGSVTSQFENHVRAITGMELGSAVSRCPAVMYNIIGVLPDLDRAAALRNAKIHLYGKEPRPGRKLGHITLVSPSPEDDKALESLIRGAS